MGQRLLLEDILLRIEQALTRLEGRIINLTIDQATFDTDLAALIQAISDLDTAVEAWIAAHPDVDLTAEDTSVQTAAAAVSAELAKLTPATPPAE
jgi:hypothetical protein